METGSGMKNELKREGGHEKKSYFIALGEVIAHIPPFSSCIYRMSSIKIPPPMCSGFAPRHKVLRDFLLHCAGRFPALPSQNPLFNRTDANKIQKQTWNMNRENKRERDFPSTQTPPRSAVWGGLHFAVKNGSSGVSQALPEESTATVHRPWWFFQVFK